MLQGLYITTHHEISFVGDTPPYGEDSRELWHCKIPDNRKYIPLYTEANESVALLCLALEMSGWFQTHQCLPIIPNPSGFNHIRVCAESCTHRGFSSGEVIGIPIPWGCSVFFFYFTAVCFSGSPAEPSSEWKGATIEKPKEGFNIRIVSYLHKLSNFATMCA